MHRNIEKKRVEEEKLVRNEAYKIFLSTDKSSEIRGLKTVRSIWEQKMEDGDSTIRRWLPVEIKCTLTLKSFCRSTLRE